MGFLLPKAPGTDSSADTAVVWRGLMVQKAVQQLLFDVDWRDPDGGAGLDVLVIDMPPGTGDVPLTLGQLVNVDGEPLESEREDSYMLSSMVCRRGHRLDTARRRAYRRAEGRVDVPEDIRACASLLHSVPPARRALSLLTTYTPDRRSPVERIALHLPLVHDPARALRAPGRVPRHGGALRGGRPRRAAARPWGEPRRRPRRSLRAA